MRANGIINRANGVRCLENEIIIHANRSREKDLTIRANGIRFRENELIIRAN